LRAAGFVVHVALPHHADLDDIATLGFPVHSIFLRRTSTRHRDELACLASFCDLYRRLRPTVVHHICLKPVLYGGIAARLTHVPAVIAMLTGLGYLFETSRREMRPLRRAVERGLRFAFQHRKCLVVLQNADDRDFLASRGVALTEQTLVIRGSGVDLSLFTPCPEPAGGPVVLMACRLLWEKGPDAFVAAARALRARGVRARFLLFGERDAGHPGAVPEAVLQDWLRNEDIEWLGWCSNMHVALSACHVVCLPSRYGEGIPRILIEAAASGRPIVTTDTPGCREVVRHGQNGILVPVGDQQALNEALCQLINDPPKRRSMGARSREIAVSEFSQKSVEDAIIGAYRGLLGRSEAHPVTRPASFLPALPPHPGPEER
jgi:glycosyltransferase involved in cell wall biosynthesis